jgi:hypothetical protein
MLPASPLVFPLGKILSVADDVVRLPGSTKLSIINLWEIVRVPAGETFPYTLGKVCAVAWMRDGLGPADFRVDVVDDSGTLIRRSQTYTHSFTHRQRSALVVIRLLDVVFPRPGVHLVELFCQNQFIDDQRIEVL